MEAFVFEGWLSDVMYFNQFALTAFFGKIFNYLAISRAWTLFFEYVVPLNVP